MTFGVVPWRVGVGEPRNADIVAAIRQAVREASIQPHDTSASDMLNRIADLIESSAVAVPVSADPDVVENVEASVRAILTDIVADRLVETVVEHVKSHLDEHARIVADRARRAPGLARLVDINLDPVGSIVAWAADYPDASAVRLRPEDVRLIFEAEEGDDRMSITLAEFRETGRVTSE